MAEGPELNFFDLRLVHDHFDKALVENDDIDLKAYLDAYNELYKLSKGLHSGSLMTVYYALFHSIANYGIIAWGGAYKNALDMLQSLQNRLLRIILKNKLMGSVFSFVSSDLKQKIDILIEQRNKDSQNYTTVKTMIDYEKENNLLEKPDFVNGARTLLRLHRGLDFIREFLRQLGDLKDCDKTSSCCQDAYGKTLAKHHPWVVRKAAVVAMYTMPTRENLFKKVCGDNVQRNIDVLPKMLEVTADVFNRTHTIYETYKLHDLP